MDERECGRHSAVVATAMPLSGKSALVTGGSRGIGRAIAAGLASAGAKVAITYSSSQTEAEALVDEIRRSGGTLHAFRADARDRHAMEETLAGFERLFGTPDILVSSAGAISRVPFLDLTDAQWQSLMDVNLTGGFIVGQLVARGMVERGKGGSIIYVTSLNQDAPSVELAHYCASKGGLGMLAKAMALELAPHRIRVNVIAPGLIETDFNRDLLQQPNYRAKRLARIPLGVIGEPRDIVGMALLLAGDDSRFVTGSTFRIDGGASFR